MIKRATTAQKNEIELTCGNWIRLTLVVDDQDAAGSPSAARPCVCLRRWLASSFLLPWAPLAACRAVAGETPRHSETLPGDLALAQAGSG